jgi:hypothetical protein
MLRVFEDRCGTRAFRGVLVAVIKSVIKGTDGDTLQRAGISAGIPLLVHDQN